ncbi:MAG: hypothetical protein J1F39_04885, partial [Clostridiales bacterium]|nr:hypothetical protein [Clostridiales bacterium]
MKDRQCGIKVEILRFVQDNLRLLRRTKILTFRNLTFVILNKREARSEESHLYSYFLNTNLNENTSSYV